MARSALRVFVFPVLAAAVLLAVPGALNVCVPAVAADAPTTAVRSARPDTSTVVELDLSRYFPRWARYRVMGVAVWQLVATFVFLALGLTLRKVSDYAFSTHIIPLLEKTPYQFDHLIARAASAPAGYLILLAGLYAAIAVLPLPASASGFVFGALQVLLAVDILWFLFRLVDVADRYLQRLAARTESKLDDQLVPVVRKALKATIGVIGFVWVIQLLGYSVSALITGLGIGGLAVALALQDTLGNFFGSVFIFLDRPFAVGDWIKLEGVEGVVEEVGFRSTRIRTFPATLVSVPNKTVAAAIIDNWSRMPKRRITQTVGVTYETSADQMEQAVEGIREILEKDEGVDKELIVVRFTEFGDSSLNISLIYFTIALSIADHWATKERVNLAIMRLVERLGLSIAFPTRTLYLEGEIARDLVERLGAPKPRIEPPTSTSGFERA